MKTINEAIDEIAYFMHGECNSGALSILRLKQMMQSIEAENTDKSRQLCDIVHRFLLLTKIADEK